MAGRDSLMALSEPMAPRERRRLLIGATVVGLLLAGLIISLALLGPPMPKSVTVAVAPPSETAKQPETARTIMLPEQTPASTPVEAGVQPGAQQLPGFNGGALLPAPDPDLIEKSANGFLPIIGRDGRQPWQVYARPFDLADKRPRVAIVITSLGPSPTAIDTAINHLPPGISLAFVPYRSKLGEWINQARGSGHEVLLDLPMEPMNYPNDDPGPEALLTALDPPSNLERLNWVMSQATGYVGLMGLMGSRFSTSHDDMLPILTALQRRGLLYVDNRSSPQTVVPDIAADIGLAAASANRQLDTELVRTAIDKKLGELEEIARRNGSALGMSHPYPIVMERIAVWAQTMEDRGTVLAPISAIIDRSRIATAKQAEKQGESAPSKPSAAHPSKGPQ